MPVLEIERTQLHVQSVINKVPAAFITSGPIHPPTKFAIKDAEAPTPFVGGAEALQGPPAMKVLVLPDKETILQVTSRSLW